MSKKLMLLVFTVSLLGLVNGVSAAVLQCDAGEGALQSGWTQVVAGLNANVAVRLNLSSEERGDIDKVVTGYIDEAKADSANDRVEARQQIERLWYVAAPTLLENANSRDPTIAETAIKSLILMRNESIVEALVQKANAAKDEYTKAMAIFALKKMQEQRKSLIPGRECLSE